MNRNEITRIKSEISKIENLIIPLEEYLIENPNDFAVKLELKSFQKRINELKLDLSSLQENFGEVIVNEEINVHLSGENIKNHYISSSLLINFIKKYEELLMFIAGALEFGIDRMDKFMDSNFKNKFGYNIAPFSEGSFVITFSPKVHENYQTTLKPSLNKNALDKLCEIIDFGENFEEIIKQSETVGMSSIIKYKEFIEVLSNNKLNISLDEGDYNHPRAQISHNKANTIYKGLKKFDDDNVKTEKIRMKGQLYYVNTDNKKCGIKFFDEDLNKYFKITQVKFREGLKSKVKENLDLEVEVTLEKTTKINVGDDSYKPIYDLVEIL